MAYIEAKRAEFSYKRITYKQKFIDEYGGFISELKPLSFLVENEQWFVKLNNYWELFHEPGTLVGPHIPYNKDNIVALYVLREEKISPWNCIVLTYPTYIANRINVKTQVGISFPADYAAQTIFWFCSEFGIMKVKNAEGYSLIRSDIKEKLKRYLNKKE